MSSDRVFFSCTAEGFDAYKQIATELLKQGISLEIASEEGIIEKCNLFLVLLTSNYLDNKMCLRQVMHAMFLQKRTMIVALGLDEVWIDKFLRDMFFKIYESYFELRSNSVESELSAFKKFETFSFHQFQQNIVSITKFGENENCSTEYEPKKPRQSSPSYTFVIDTRVTAAANLAINTKSLIDDGKKEADEEEARRILEEDPVVNHDMIEPLKVNCDEPTDLYAKEVVKVFRSLKTAGLIPYCRFDLKKALQHIYTKLKSGSNTTQVPQMYIGGHTQLGKTMFKFVTTLLANEMNIPTMVISNQSSSVRELRFKFQNYRKRCEDLEELPIVERNSPRNRAKLFQEKRGVIFVAFDVNNVTNMFNTWEEAYKISETHFLLLLDEADDFFKNDELSNRAMRENALYKLMGNGITCIPPALVLYVSATLLPIFIQAAFEENPKFVRATISPDDVVILTPPEEYVSIEKHFSFHDLGHSAVNSANCFTNENMWKFYDEAVSANQGSLILDITNRKVDSEGGIIDKAKRISERYSHEHYVICIHGRGIDLFYPSSNRELNTVKIKSIGLGSLIDYIDEGIPISELGCSEPYKGPIFVIGYTMMNRGLSVRGGKRVPTHIIVVPRNFDSIEKVVQAFGRATGLFLSQLKILNIENVQLLCSENDYLDVLNYCSILNDLVRQLKECHGNVLAALKNVCMVYDVLKLPRQIGNRGMKYKDKLKKKFPELLDPIPEFTEEELKQKTIQSLKQEIFEVYNIEGYYSKMKKDVMVQIILDEIELRQEHRRRVQ